MCGEGLHVVVIVVRLVAWDVVDVKWDATRAEDSLRIYEDTLRQRCNGVAHWP
jgi:hypothetical protein